MTSAVVLVLVLVVAQVLVGSAAADGVRAMLEARAAWQDVSPPAVDGSRVLRVVGELRGLLIVPVVGTVAAAVLVLAHLALVGAVVVGLVVAMVRELRG